MPKTYTVKPGDTLSKIGSQFGIDWHKITGFRSGDPNIIHPGEVLTIPEEAVIPPTGVPPTTPTGYIKVTTDKGLPASWPAGQPLPPGYTKVEKAPPAPGVPPGPPEAPPEAPPGVLIPPKVPLPGILPKEPEIPPEKEVEITDIETQIAEIKNKIAIATTDLERETAIQDMVTLAASLGLKYPAEVIEALTKPAGETEAEIRTKLYDKYGIEDLEAKFKDRPEQTFEEIYSSAYSDLKLGELKAEIDEIRKKIADAEGDRDEAIEKIRENPWLHEASKVGRIRRVQDAAEAKLTRLVNQLTLADNMYTRGKQEAENVATRALNTFVREREWTKEELDYYIKRAETDIEAKMKLAEKEEAKELYRYYPEYLKDVAEVPVEKKGGQLKQLESGEWAWMYPDGTTIPTGEFGKEKKTEAEKKVEAIRGMTSQFNVVKGTDGYISPKDWKTAKKAWGDEGLKPEDFIKQFYMYINPTHSGDYGTREANYLKGQEQAIKIK